MQAEETQRSRPDEDLLVRRGTVRSGSASRVEWERRSGWPPEDKGGEGSDEDRGGDRVGLSRQSRQGEEEPR